MLSMVGIAQHSQRRKPRADVYYGAGAEHPMASLVGFGAAPPLRRPSKGARAADPRAGELDNQSWVRCHICAKLCGYPGILVHEPQCYKKYRANAMSRPPSRRLPPPERPPLGSDIEAYNVAAQLSSDLCCLAPCPQCGRKMNEDKLRTHVRSCEDEPPDDLEPPPVVAWGTVTEVGLEWSVEELELFCKRSATTPRLRPAPPRPASARAATGQPAESANVPDRRRRAAAGRAERDPDQADWVLAAGPIRDHAWDVNGLGHRQLVAKVNLNLKAAPRTGPADSGPQLVGEFKDWLAGQFGAAPKAKARTFERTLRRPSSSGGSSSGGKSLRGGRAG